MAHLPISKRGVYAIDCVDGRSYVGSSNYLVGRWSGHRHDLRRRGHRNRPLQDAWDQMGEGAFVFRVLEYVPHGDMRAVEQEWMDRLRATGDLFNIYPTAGSPRGATHTAEARAANAAAQKGIQAGEKNPNAKMTPEMVKEVRRLAAGGQTHPEIASRFDTCRVNIGKIVRRQSWAHIP